MAGLEQERAGSVAKAESLARLLEEETAGVGELEAALAAVQAKADQAAEQITTAKVEVSRLTEQLLRRGVSVSGSKSRPASRSGPKPRWSRPASGERPHWPNISGLRRQCHGGRNRACAGRNSPA